MLKTRKNIASNLPVMRRTWVETGDARCPIACVWFALGRADAAEGGLQDLSEGDQPWPALLRFKLIGGQAFSSLFHSAA